MILAWTCLNSVLALLRPPTFLLLTDFAKTTTSSSSTLALLVDALVHTLTPSHAAAVILGPYRLGIMKTIIAFSALAALASAQVQILQFGSNQLPTCAQNCQVLLNAQIVCVPPAAPVTNAQTYKSCFCQSGYLNTLGTDASTICDTTCTSQTDRTQIQSWYKSYCANANALPSGTAAGISTTSTTPATASTGTAASTTAGSSATATAATAKPVDNDHSWYVQYPLLD